MTTDPGSFGFSARARRTQRQPIGFLMAQAVQNPDVISLAAGLVDYDTLPGAEAADLVAAMMRDDQLHAALQYGTTEGLRGLREAVFAHMAALDGWKPAEVAATPDDVLITTGSQQMLFLLGDVLIDPGDIVITCWPSYFVYTGVLESLGAHVRCADMDDDGLVPESLERVFAALQAEGSLGRTKILYLVSYYQNPTGISLARHRRKRVVDIVRRYSRDHRILIVEDAAYRELTFGGDVPPSLKVFDPENRFVALLQTFSKTFSPGLKVGYGLLPRDLVEPVTLQKGSHDFGSASFCQQLILRALKTGAYARHAAEVCRSYAVKRTAMLEALDEHMGRLHMDIHWTRPSGGLYVFLTLPEGMETHTRSPLFARALAEGMMYVPGEYCYPPDPQRTIPQNTMRLSYGVCGVDDIRAGIAALARAVEAVATSV